MPQTGSKAPRAGDLEGKLKLYEEAGLPEGLHEPGSKLLALEEDSVGIM